MENTHFSFDMSHHEVNVVLDLTGSPVKKGVADALHIQPYRDIYYLYLSPTPPPPEKKNKTKQIKFDNENAL